MAKIQSWPLLLALLMLTLPALAGEPRPAPLPAKDTAELQRNRPKDCISRVTVGLA
jgi:hypothetical protein